VLLIVRHGFSSLRCHLTGLRLGFKARGLPFQKKIDSAKLAVNVLWQTVDLSGQSASSKWRRLERYLTACLEKTFPKLF
jgi:hypothetical protein